MLLRDYIHVSQQRPEIIDGMKKLAEGVEALADFCQNHTCKACMFDEVNEVPPKKKEDCLLGKFLMAVYPDEIDIKPVHGG